MRNVAHRERVGVRVESPASGSLILHGECCTHVQLVRESSLTPTPAGILPASRLLTNCPTIPPMPARPRFLRILKWLTLGLCLLTFAAMAASGLRTIYYEAHGWGLRLDEGILTAHWGFPSESVPPGRGLYGWNFRPMTTRLGFRLLFPKLESWPDGRTILYLGVWILLVPLATTTAVLWWLDRRRIPPGHCRHCGYNLTGNTSGRCPECGTACDIKQPSIAQDRLKV
jgi:hypothetical protein